MMQTIQWNILPCRTIRYLTLRHCMMQCFVMLYNLMKYYTHLNKKIQYVNDPIYWQYWCKKRVGITGNLIFQYIKLWYNTSSDNTLGFLIKWKIQHAPKRLSAGLMLLIIRTLERVIKQWHDWGEICLDHCNISKLKYLYSGVSDTSIVTQESFK